MLDPRGGLAAAAAPPPSPARRPAGSGASITRFVNIRRRGRHVHRGRRASTSPTRTRSSAGMRRSSCSSALTVVILGGALTRLLVTSTFTPLRDVEATAARFADGDFSQRLAGATPNTEVGRLNRSLNTMLNRIDQAFADRARTIDQMRRFVGDASHELRTPLVSVRGYAELYRMGALTKPEDVAQAMERIEKEAIRMGVLVEDLLELARLDEAKPLELDRGRPRAHRQDAALDAMASRPRPRRRPSSRPTDPRRRDDQAARRSSAVPPRRRTQRPRRSPTGPIAFAGATLARLRRRAARARREDRPGRACRQSTAAAVLGAGRARRGEQDPPGGHQPDGQRPPVHARGHPDRDRRRRRPRQRRRTAVGRSTTARASRRRSASKIFQRFWRADTSRDRDTGGSGLGLAIVASIVDAHQGNVEVLETLAAARRSGSRFPSSPRARMLRPQPPRPDRDRGPAPLHYRAPHDPIPGRQRSRPQCHLRGAQLDHPHPVRGARPAGPAHQPPVIVDRLGVHRLPVRRRRLACDAAARRGDPRRHQRRTRHAGQTYADIEAQNARLFAR